MLPSATHKGVVVRTGTYTGNGSQNRAIAHGLGVKPKGVLMSETGGTPIYFTMHVMTLTHGVNSTNDYTDTVTDADATNFYVGGPAATYIGNWGGVVYNWVAIG